MRHTDQYESNGHVPHCAVTPDGDVTMNDDDRWCQNRRAEVARYLRGEQVLHGRSSAKPVWHLAPYVALWAIESAPASDSIGWWVICGDLRTDYVSAQQAPDPRAALIAFAARWREVADYMARGDRHPTIEIGDPATWPKLAPLLKKRADLLTSSLEASDRARLLGAQRDRSVPQMNKRC